MTLCYLGLGSNLRSPQRQLRQAITLLQKLPRTTMTNISSLYFSKPLGIRAQPHYCNLVIALHTTLSAIWLLRYCQSIEKKHQRVRKERWGARTLDIDILLFGETTMNTLELVIPHPQMLNRDFVLTPLLEIAPDIRFPNGNHLGSYLKYCEEYLIPSNNLLMF